MPGLARSTGSSTPTAMASSAEPCSDEAIGSRVKRRLAHAPAIVSSPSGLVVIASMPALTVGLGGVGILVGDVDRVGETDDERLDHVGVLVEELGRHDQVGRDEVTLRPQVGLVDEHVAATFEHEAGRPRLGDPRAVEGAGLECSQRVGVVLRRDAARRRRRWCRWRSPRRAARPAVRRPGCCRATARRAWRRRGRPGSRCLRARRATRRPTWCRRRSAALRRRTWRSR